MSSIISLIGYVFFISGASIEFANCYLNFRHLKDKKTSTIAIVPIIFYLLAFTLIGSNNWPVFGGFAFNPKVSVIILISLHIFNIVIFPLMMRSFDKK